MVKHRYRTAALLGRWFSTRHEAYRDALRVGVARQDKTRADKLNWAVPGELETRRAAITEHQYGLAFPGGRRSILKSGGIG